LQFAGHNNLPPLAETIASFFFLPIAVPAGQVMRPLLHVGWTLNYEMLFYAMFCCVMVLSLRLGSLVIFAALCAAVVLGAFIKPPSDPSDPHTLVTFWTDPIILLFGFGCAIGLLRVRVTRLAFRHPTAIAFTSLSLAVGLFVLMQFHYPMNFYSRAIFWPFVLVAVTMCAFSTPHVGAIGRVVAQLGDASYSTYLFHLFGLRLLQKVAMSHKAITGYIAIYLLLSLVLAHFTGLVAYRLVERPLTKRLRALLVRDRMRNAAATNRPRLSHQTD
jgi:exopolysaccharide production protein ExoZ